MKHHAPRSNIGLPRTSRATLLVVAFVMPSMPALAAELSRLDSWRSLLPTHGGWTMLAGLGLIAVAITALTVRRPRKDSDAAEQPLGRMHTGHDAASEPRLADALAPAAVPGDAPAEVARRIPSPSPSKLAEPPAEPSRPLPLPAGGSHLFLALHHVDLSIDVLRRHLESESRPMPAVWLMLLDLCRTHGREQTFRELALEFHRRFNVRTPDWEGFPPSLDEPGLEAYPRLVKEITLTWGTHEGRRLLDRLLYDNRGGQRRGFTLNAYNDAIALRRAADAVLDTIEQDLAEEAKVRSAFASASAEIGAASSAERAPEPSSSPLVQDLENQLDSDLRVDVTPQSAIEREHPALAGMLAREWGNAALSARLCDMLARGGDGAHSLSKEAADEVALLRCMAERLLAANGIDAPVTEPR